MMWIGLSTPKQERFMAKHIVRLQTKLMIGVGAAFDYHTAEWQDAPAWIKKSGLQWLHSWRKIRSDYGNDTWSTIRFSYLR